MRKYFNEDSDVYAVDLNRLNSNIDTILTPSHMIGTGEANIPYGVVTSRVHGTDNQTIMNEWLTSIGVTASALGTTTTSLRAQVEVSSQSNQTGVQTITFYIASPTVNHRILAIYKRSCNVGVWGQWNEIRVSIEKGSNTNGSYVRYSDGTMKCEGELTNLLTNTQTSTSGIWYGIHTFTFPSTFTVAPKVLLSDNHLLNLGFAGLRSISTTGFTVYQFAFANGREARIGYVAEGRWRT